MKADPPPRGASFHDTMTEVLARAHVDKSSTIRVMGSGGLAPLLWLCRHGYEQVGFVRPGPCPADSCDLLIILDAAGVDGLARCLEDGPHLRDGGVLVVQMSPANPGGGDPVRRLLAREGYGVEPHIHGQRRDLYLARRHAADRFRKAA